MVHQPLANGTRAALVEIGTFAVRRYHADPASDDAMTMAMHAGGIKPSQIAAILDDVRDHFITPDRAGAANGSLRCAPPSRAPLTPKPSGRRSHFEGAL